MSDASFKLKCREKALEFYFSIQHNIIMTTKAGEKLFITVIASKYYVTNIFVREKEQCLDRGDEGR